mmetsp:Transcript_2600/g.5193  ORF Transcript_2600/g.5193 Transcript_2600/m.5193 type:complete len:446 (-) Transcript_2600:320-1657(-)|eukprot:CAMPEP_0182587246 /NCGR_PEP_ID=MMETSP1324-20130603/64594_1 /TAXON_ID=236786 /ORGANISM="Florenciella sp., Strain RCC1587" /LENGTH=445 /DNA_ID=CAMNT_0024804221 /DNA_START=153 /DNA_END=1490 /DNA_ORIENTATION=-
MSVSEGLMSKGSKKITVDPMLIGIGLGAAVAAGYLFRAVLADIAYLIRSKEMAQAEVERAKEEIAFNRASSDQDLKTVDMPAWSFEQKMAARIKKQEEENTIQQATIAEMAVPRRKVTVRVPATTANLGPGFDTIGMALDMWSEVTVELSDKFEIINEGDGADAVPTDETNLVVVALKRAYEMAGKEVPALKYTCINRIPYARGLGSSSAAIVGGIIAGLVLSGHKLKMWGAEELLQIAATIEGHPDNVAPAIYGGIQLGIHDGERWRSERVNMPAGLQVVVFIPSTIGKTSDARKALPKDYSIKDCVYNIGRIAWLVNALASNNLDNLKFGVQDKLHQPQRGEKVYPHLMPMISAAEAAGACCCYLSGAGPSVLAITSGQSGDIFAQREKERVDRSVADAMLMAAKQAGMDGEVFITNPILSGAYVAEVEPSFSSGLVTYKGDV